MQFCKWKEKKNRNPSNKQQKKKKIIKELRSWISTFFVFCVWDKDSMIVLVPPIISHVALWILESGIYHGCINIRYMLSWK